MKPYLSIIIPYHNSETTIGSLLVSITTSKKAPPYEVLIVDDGSRNPLRMGNLEFRVKKTFSLKIIRMKHNKGPAAARNRGAREARGKFLVFIDSDIELLPDTLYNLA